MPLFINKLRAKNQKEHRQKQAAHAIQLYYALNVSHAPLNEQDRTHEAQQKQLQNTSQNSPVNTPISAWTQIYVDLDAVFKMRHYSPKTYKTYAMWIRKLQHFSHEKAPDSLSSEDVKAFLTHLAVNRKVAASTQNQAFNALLFLFHHILKVVKLLYGCGLRLFECLQLRINHYLHHSGAVRP